MTDRSLKDFRIFCKWFTVRVAQIVIQSRLGKKFRTQSTVSGTDWFNLTVDPMDDTLPELRKSLGNLYPPDVTCVCVDILLCRAEGESLGMETWCLKFDPDKIDPDSNVANVVYHRMSTFLRSVLAASRTTPCYKYYSRRQGPESFVLLYQVYTGEPKSAALGSCYRSLNIGYVTSPYGTLSLTLDYRTRMIMGSSISETDLSLNEQHFSERNPPVGIPRPINSHTSPLQISSAPCLAAPFGRFPAWSHRESFCGSPVCESPEGAFHALFSTSPLSEESLPFGKSSPPLQKKYTTPNAALFNLSETSSSESSGKQRSGEYGADTVLGDIRARENSGSALFRLDLSTESSPKHTTTTLPEPTETRELDEVKVYDPDLPFAELLGPSPPEKDMAPVSRSITLTGISSDRPKNPRAPRVRGFSLTEVYPKETVSIIDYSKSKCDSDTCDDVELSQSSRAAFAPRDDLGLFMQDCKSAPPMLDSFQFPEPDFGNVAAQLEVFENQRLNFDEFVRSLEDDDEES